MAVKDYNRLNYIGATGTQYILTDYYANNNTYVRLYGDDWHSIGGRTFFGARTGNENNGFYVLQQAASGNYSNQIRFAYNNANYHISVVGSDVAGYPFTLNCNKNTFRLTYGASQTDVSYTFTAGTFTNAYPMVIFGINDGGSIYNLSSYNLKQLAIYTNGTLNRNYLPAERKSDGVLGVYDVVNDNFYANNGTGTFTNGGYVTTRLLTLTASMGGMVSGGGWIPSSPDNVCYTTITATPSTNWSFDGWYSDSSYQTLISSNASYDVSFSSGTTIYAKFVPAITITLTYDANLGSASYEWTSDTEITLTAVAEDIGYFNGWYYNSVQLSHDNPYVYEPSGDMTIEARFDEIYTVTAISDGNGSISYTRGVDPNDVTFTVIPNANYHFLKYTANGSDYSTTPLTLHLIAATTITAYFEEDTLHTITVTTTIPNGSVYVSSNPAYYGQSVTLWARPYPNYNFVRWDDGNTSNPRTITIAGDVTLVAEYQREFETNGIYQYRCYVKDQMDLTEKPKAFMRVDTFNIKNDLMTTANSTITVLDSFSNVNNGDVLVLYDPMGTTLYQGVIKSIEDNEIVCSQMQSFYAGKWIYNIHASASLEEELAYLLGQYAAGKIYGSSYTDPLVAQRLSGFTIDYTASTTVNLPTDLDKDGNENLTQYDMEKFIYEMYEKYGIIFDFEINFSGTNYVHIKVPTYSTMKVGNNMYAIKDMKPVTTIEETNRLIIFAKDKTYRTTYVATTSSIVEEPSTTTNRFDLTNTKIVFSDDAVADLIAANLPDQMYNHKLDFVLVIKNFIYQFGDFNLGGQMDVYYYDEYYNSVLSGYEISKESNKNITDVKMVCGKVRSKLTQKLTLGRLQ